MTTPASSPGGADVGVAARTAWRVGCHRRTRLPRLRRRRGHQVDRRARRRPRRQRRPVARRRRRCSPPTGSRPRRCCGRSRSPSGRLRAVVLNSGGANACTGPDGFQDTHATAEHVAELLGISAGRRRGLLHRPDRRAAADGQAAGGRRLRPPRPCPAGRRRRGRGDPHDRHRRQDRRRPPATAAPSAAWPRAPGCSRPAWPRCCACSPPTPTSTPPTCSTARCARPPRGTFDRIDSDGCMSTNDTVMLLASRRLRRRARRRPSSPRRCARSAPTWPGS